MEKYFIPNGDEKEKCDTGYCRQCTQCRVVDIEDTRAELRMNSSQLYAKEAENYFFYFGHNMKQSS
jgi:hypothetical protein